MSSCAHTLNACKGSTCIRCKLASDGRSPEQAAGTCTSKHLLSRAFAGQLQGHMRTRACDRAAATPVELDKGHGFPALARASSRTCARGEDACHQQSPQYSSLAFTREPYRASQPSVTRTRSELSERKMQCCHRQRCGRAWPHRLSACRTEFSEGVERARRQQREASPSALHALHLPPSSLLPARAGRPPSGRERSRVVEEATFGALRPATHRAADWLCSSSFAHKGIVIIRSNGTHTDLLVRPQGAVFCTEKHALCRHNFFFLRSIAESRLIDIQSRRGRDYRWSCHKAFVNTAPSPKGIPAHGCIAWHER